MPEKTEMTFEEAFARLAKIAQELESKESGLEESVKLYEEAIKLRRFCQEYINKIELKITKLNDQE